VKFYYDLDKSSKFLAGLIGIGLFGFLCVVAAKLCYYHLANHTPLTREYSVDLIGLRGSVFDRNGRSTPLAMTLPARLVFLDPLDPKFTRSKKPISKDYVARELGGLLKMDDRQIFNMLQRTDSRYIQLDVTLDDNVISNLNFRVSAAAKDQQLAGVGLKEEPVRRYPQGRRMAHVIGFANKLGVGGAGVELKFDSMLKGVPGKIDGEKDARQAEIFTKRKEKIDPIPGADVHLTLDHMIQYIAERELRATIDKFQATGGFVIVQKVKTGEILAMASYPEFDPNNYTQETPETWRNNALAIVYEPGSTMKSMIVSAALNEGVITPSSRFDVGYGPWFYAGKPLRDHVTGVVDTGTALKKSSNIACAKIGLMLGNQRMENYLRAFGFGSKLGIDLPGEESGILAKTKHWSMLSPTRIAIGQGVAVTGIQMLNAYCTIANGGRLMRPYVVSRIVNSDGVVLVQNKPEVLGRPITAETARKVREMLRGVTEDGGTATRANVRGYTVAGKTGTAQMVIGGTYSQTDYHASFVGYLPATAPEIGIIVVIERPKPQHTGGYVSAPAFSRIAEATANYLGIPSDLKEGEIE